MFDGVQEKVLEGADAIRQIAPDLPFSTTQQQEAHATAKQAEEEEEAAAAEAKQLALSEVRACKL